MRFVSPQSDGFRVFAVSGTNTVSFAVQSSESARRGVLGFAVERVDPTEDEQYMMRGYRVFRSVIPKATPDMAVSTWDHPVQSFVWDDFTAKPDRHYQYRFYPVRGRAKKLDHSADPVAIDVRTEPLWSSSTHDIFFNRGVASSQAYQRRFGNLAPNDPRLTPDEQTKALQWLTRELDEAVMKFVKQAKAGDSLLCCFYEFRYLPVAEELKRAIDRGVGVRIIIDAKINESTDKKGEFHESFPREDNLRTIRKAKLPKNAIIKRLARTNSIQHNKFMVLLRGAAKVPAEVWTGSTNISIGGFSGQTNVGHWVRDAGVASRFKAYWECLADDPGGRDDDDKGAVRTRNRQFRSSVESLAEVPTSVDEIKTGITTVFSPRSQKAVLDCYARLVDEASSCTCITLAFGIGDVFKQYLQDNSASDHLVFMLLEKRDQPNSRSRKPFVSIGASNNVYKAWGSYIKDPVYQWARETNARALGVNSHVAYIHSKFLLRDPLGPDPIVVTGSANFSEPSTTENDENMLIIRGDHRVADVYFTEFNRLFNHYYFRAVVESAHARGKENDGASLFLEDGTEWQQKYVPGTLKAKRLGIYTGMSATRTL